MGPELVDWALGLLVDISFSLYWFYLACGQFLCNNAAFEESGTGLLHFDPRCLKISSLGGSRSLAYPLSTKLLRPLPQWGIRQPSTPPRCTDSHRPLPGKHGSLSPHLPFYIHLQLPKSDSNRCGTKTPLSPHLIIASDCLLAK